MSFTEKKQVDEIKVENIHDLSDIYTPVIAPTASWSHLKYKLTTRDGWIGNYDYRALWYYTHSNISHLIITLFSIT